MIRKITWSLLRPLWDLVMRATVATSDKTRVYGFEVANLRSAETDVFAEKLQAAFQVIEVTDPALFRGVRRRLQRIIIADGEVGYYHPRMRGAVIGAAYFERCSAEDIALVIVHEATHARIWSRGIRTTATRRARIEEICIDAEIAFAEKLPNARTVIAGIRKKSARPWWTDEILGERLASLVPRGGERNWLARMVKRLPRWMGVGEG
jgi:hypothetical protein